MEKVKERYNFFQSDLRHEHICTWCGKTFMEYTSCLIEDGDHNLFCSPKCRALSNKRIRELYEKNDWENTDYYENWKKTMEAFDLLEKSHYTLDISIAYKIGKGEQPVRVYGHKLKDRKGILTAMRKVKMLCRSENRRDYEIWLRVNAYTRDGTYDKEVENWLLDKTNDLLYYYTLCTDGAMVEEAGRGVKGGLLDKGLYRWNSTE